MTSSPHGLYALGCTRATMDGTKGCNGASRSGSPKTVLSWDRSLQLDSVNLDSLVTASQHIAVNMFPGLVHTARQVMKAGNT